LVPSSTNSRSSWLGYFSAAQFGCLSGTAHAAAKRDTDHSHQWAVPDLLQKQKTGHRRLGRRNAGFGDQVVKGYLQTALCGALQHALHVALGVTTVAIFFYMDTFYDTIDHAIVHQGPRPRFAHRTVLVICCAPEFDIFDPDKLSLTTAAQCYHWHVARFRRPIASTS
jgi:hypothetical protein